MRFLKFRFIPAVFAGLIPVTLLGIGLFLFIYAWPAITFNGFSFLFHTRWDLGNLYANPVMLHGHLVPRGADYGVAVFIVGTLFSSFLALLIALPVSVGVVIFLAEGAPPFLRFPLSVIVDMLAIVPSVVYGLWGIFVLVPLIGFYIIPAFQTVFSGWLPFLAGTGGGGYGLFASGIILALMITPIISATLLDAMRRVPKEAKEAAYSLGATKFEVVSKTMLPMVRISLVSSTVLGLGRALGETMAVLMVAGGGLNSLPHSLFSPISTMASFIASQLDSALTDATGMAVRSLAEIALLLFVISMVVNVFARLFTRKQS